MKALAWISKNHYADGPLIWFGMDEYWRKTAVISLGNFEYDEEVEENLVSVLVIAFLPWWASMYNLKNRKLVRYERKRSAAFAELPDDFTEEQIDLLEDLWVEAYPEGPPKESKSWFASS